MKLHLIALLLLVGGAASGQSKRTVISADEFERQINALNDEQLVDVRTPDEFSKGYIEGALNIDINGSEFRRQASALDKSKPVYVYCLSGGRSANAAEYLRKNGFENVIELDGGLMKWNRAKKPLTGRRSTSKGMSLVGFNEAVTKENLVLVDFYAPWCAPCRKMAPELEELRASYPEKLSLLKINADESRHLMDSLEIGAIPQLMLFKDGKLLWSHSGLAEKEKVKEAIDENLQ